MIVGGRGARGRRETIWQLADLRRRLAAAEDALARWSRPKGRSMPPATDSMLPSVPSMRPATACSGPAGPVHRAAGLRAGQRERGPARPAGAWSRRAPGRPGRVSGTRTSSCRTGVL